LAEEDVRQAQLRLDELKCELKVNVQDCLLSLEEVGKRLAYLEELLEQRQAAVSLTEKKIGRGGATELELLQRKIEAATASTDYVEAMYEYEYEKANLYRIMGRGLQL
jgi:outer membrane protein TolC